MVITMSTNQIFERIEKKFLLTKEQFVIFQNKIASYMKMDNYGEHTICNLYFDTDDYELIYSSIEKPVYKEKLRLRSYGVPEKNSKVFLELKKKYQGIVYKRRVEMTFQEAINYLSQGIHPDCDSQILKEIDYFKNFYHPVPKVIIAYDRIAYAGIEDKELRITFDKNIRSRFQDLHLNHNDDGELLLENKEFLMEIKIPGALPLWLARILSELEIYPVSFSKYGRIYQKRMETLWKEEMSQMQPVMIANLMAIGRTKVC